MNFFKFVDINVDHSFNYMLTLCYHYKIVSFVYTLSFIILDS